MRRATRHLIKRKELTLTDETREIWDSLSLLEREGESLVEMIFNTKRELLTLKDGRLNEESKHYYSYLNFIVNNLNQYGALISSMTEAQNLYRSQLTQIEDEIWEASKMKQFVAKGRNSL